jgi:hypothetical protein
MEGLEGTTTSATPVVNATTTTKPAAPIAQTTTTTPVIQATSSPTVTTDPIPTSKNTVNNLASLMETPTISTATIVKISDIQTQASNLRTILQNDVVNSAMTALKLLETPDLKKALSIISKPVRQNIENLVRNMDKIYMNLASQTIQIQDNLTNFKNQYQNL